MRADLLGATEVTEIFSAGVYALAKRGVVIYVGKSKQVYARLYAHRTTAQRAARGKAIPTWMPIKGFVFDQAFVWTCTVDELDRLEAEMIERYKPRYNYSLKSSLKTSVMNIPGFAFNQRRVLGIERRV